MTYDNGTDDFGIWRLCCAPFSLLIILMDQVQYHVGLDH